MSKDFYVYGLIDPRTNNYFYIGKGKGRRFASHMNKGNKRDFNTNKLNRINEIEHAGLQVKTEVLFPNVTEEEAFRLEDILIYKLGREFLSEGVLTNISPGGKWNPGNSILYSGSFDDSFDLNKLDWVAQEKFLNIQKISNHNYLRNGSPEKTIFIYSSTGDFLRTSSLKCFFLPNITGAAINTIKAVTDNEYPVVCRHIYSKVFTEKIYISERIPYADYDLIDEDFNRQFDELYEKKKTFTLVCTVQGTKRIEVLKNKDEIHFTSYFPSGRKKAFRQIKNKRLFGISCDWYENGNLQVKEELFDGYYNYSRITYFPSGQKDIEIYVNNKVEGEGKYLRWYENGKLQVKYIKDVGYVHYNLKGERTKVIS